MRMAKSKQINFSLQSNYQVNDKQENVIDQTGFIENPRNTRMVKLVNSDFKTLLYIEVTFYFYTKGCK